MKNTHIEKINIIWSFDSYAQISVNNLFELVPPEAINIVWSSICMRRFFKQSYRTCTPSSFCNQQWTLHHSFKIVLDGFIQRVIYYKLQNLHSWLPYFPALLFLLSNWYPRFLYRFQSSVLIVVSEMTFISWPGLLNCIQDYHYDVYYYLKYILTMLFVCTLCI